MTGKGEYAGISVFFPAAGFGSGTSLISAGSGGYYWSSSLSPIDPRLARFLDFSSSYVNPQTNTNSRYFGYSVRPVSD